MFKNTEVKNSKKQLKEETQLGMTGMKEKCEETKLTSEERDDLEGFACHH